MRVTTKITVVQLKLNPSEHNLSAREKTHWNIGILARGNSRVLPTYQPPFYTFKCIHETDNDLADR